MLWFTDPAKYTGLKASPRPGIRIVALVAAGWAILFSCLPRFGLGRSGADFRGPRAHCRDRLKQLLWRNLLQSSYCFLLVRIEVTVHFKRYQIIYFDG